MFSDSRRIPDGRPEDEHANADGERRVNPGLFRPQNGPAAEDHGQGGERVSNLVKEGAAHVQVAAAVIQHVGDSAIDDQAGGGDPDHGPAMHLRGRIEAVPRLVKNEERDQHQGHGVDERGQHPGAVVAVGFGGGGGAHLPVNGHRGEQQREKVAYVVGSFGKQRQAVGLDSGNDQQSNVEDGYDHGDAQRARSSRRRPMIVGMHSSSLAMPAQSSNQS